MKFKPSLLLRRISNFSISSLTPSDDPSDRGSSGKASPNWTGRLSKGATNRPLPSTTFDALLPSPDIPGLPCTTRNLCKVRNRVVVECLQPGPGGCQLDYRPSPFGCDNRKHRTRDGVHGVQRGVTISHNTRQSPCGGEISECPHPYPIESLGLLRQADAPRQIIIARVGSKAVQMRVRSKMNYPGGNMRFALNISCRIQVFLYMPGTPGS